MLALYRAGRQAEALAGVPRRAPHARRGAGDRARPRAAAARAGDPRAGSGARPHAARARAAPRRRPDVAAAPAAAPLRVVAALAGRGRRRPSPWCSLGGGAEPPAARSRVPPSSRRRASIPATARVIGARSPIGGTPTSVVRRRGRASGCSNADRQTVSRVDPRHARGQDVRHRRRADRPRGRAPARCGSATAGARRAPVRRAADDDGVGARSRFERHPRHRRAAARERRRLEREPARPHRRHARRGLGGRTPTSASRGSIRAPGRSPTTSRGLGAAPSRPATRGVWALGIDYSIARIDARAAAAASGWRRTELSAHRRRRQARSGRRRRTTASSGASIPRRASSQRTIPVGPGVNIVAVGGGAVLGRQLAARDASRSDRPGDEPGRRDDRSSAARRAGSRFGAGRLWVTVAGAAAPRRPAPAASAVGRCRPIDLRARLLRRRRRARIGSIVSDLPLRGGRAPADAADERRRSRSSCASAASAPGRFSRLPVLRRLDRADGHLRPHKCARQRQAFVAGAGGDRRGRALQLRLRLRADPDRDRGTGRRARDDLADQRRCPALTRADAGEPRGRAARRSTRPARRNYARVFPTEARPGQPRTPRSREALGAAPRLRRQRRRATARCMAVTASGARRARLRPARRRGAAVERRSARSYREARRHGRRARGPTRCSSAACSTRTAAPSSGRCARDLRSCRADHARCDGLLPVSKLFAAAGSGGAPASTSASAG